MLRMLGCDYAQGYFISPPLPAEKLQGVVAHIAVGSAGSEPAASGGRPDLKKRPWQTAPGSSSAGDPWPPQFGPLGSRRASFTADHWRRRSASPTAGWLARSAEARKPRHPASC
jgi:hypothetical protein